MATTSHLLLLCIFFISSVDQSASALDFMVGGMDGWIVPPDNDTSYYNEWASKNRFRLGDMINFRYKKDSVMEVRPQDYKICNSTHPLFFSNTGNTVYKLRSKRAYYFISGVSGHCEMGQKVIIKVLAADEFGDEDAGGRESSDATALAVGVSKMLMVSVLAAVAAAVVF